MRARPASACLIAQRRQFDRLAVSIERRQLELGELGLEGALGGRLGTTPTLTGPENASVLAFWPVGFPQSFPSGLNHTRMKPARPSTRRSPGQGEPPGEDASGSRASFAGLGSSERPVAKRRAPRSGDPPLCRRLTGRLIHR